MAEAEPAAPSRPARPRPVVGRHVRHWRRERGLTLAGVADRTGLNVGYLSQIENDKASPSLEALAALGDALEVPITWFLLDSVPPPRVVRADERRVREGPGGARLEHVDGGAARDLRIVLATAPPGIGTGLHAHSGDEHHFVLSGRMRVRQADFETELGPGDYLLWDATVPHTAETVGDEPAALLLITHGSHGPSTD